MKHIKQVFVFLSLSFLHRLQSRSQTRSSSSSFHVSGDEQLAPSHLARLSSAKRRKNKSPKTQRMGDRDTRDGWWTGTSDLTRKGPGSFSVSDTHGWFLPSWLYYISLQPFFFSSIPWCFSPIEREKTRIYFHHSLRPVIHTHRHKKGHQSPNHKKMKAKLENRFIVYLLRYIISTWWDDDPVLG